MTTKGLLLQLTLLLSLTSYIYCLQCRAPVTVPSDSRCSHGPYTIHAKASTTPCTSSLAIVMDNCLKQCMHDHCCRGVGLRNGQCVTTIFPDPSHIYVKQIHCSNCFNISVCLVTSPICSSKFGAEATINYDFESTFRKVGRTVREITVYYCDSYGIIVACGLKFNYGGGVEILGGADKDYFDICTLGDNERIMNVIVMKHMISIYPVAGGLKFQTTHKVCGPFGYVGSEQYEYPGDTLLYVKGKTGAGIDTIEFFYSRTCATSIIPPIQLG